MFSMISITTILVKLLQIIWCYVLGQASLSAFLTICMWRHNGIISHTPRLWRGAWSTPFVKLFFFIEKKQRRDRKSRKKPCSFCLKFMKRDMEYSLREAVLFYWKKKQRRDRKSRKKPCSFCLKFMKRDMEYPLEKLFFFIEKKQQRRDRKSRKKQCSFCLKLLRNEENVSRSDMYKTA